MKKILTVFSLWSGIIGIILLVGGAWGVAFTYTSVSREKIVTPEDASLPRRAVRGPLTLEVQSEIIREHTLKTTGGKTFAEMPRQIEKLDANGNPVLDASGKPVMVPNTARDMWITATTLTTALGLGLLAYAFSGLAILLGCFFVFNSIVFRSLSRGKITV